MKLQNEESILIFRYLFQEESNAAFLFYRLMVENGILCQIFDFQILHLVAELILIFRCLFQAESNAAFLLQANGRKQHFVSNVLIFRSFI